MIVTVLKNFKHGGKSYHQGETPNLVSTVARELASTGNVSLNGTPPLPLFSRGPALPSFVSPPVQVSPMPTSIESSDGEAADAEVAEGKSKKQRRKDADE